MNYINLDSVIPEDRGIEVHGVKYIIPGSIPVRIMLKAIKSSQKVMDDSTNADAIEEAFKALYEIFLIRQPELKYDEFSNSTSFEEYIALVNYIFAGITPEDSKKKLDEIKKTENDVKKKE